jgi:hypothetical protein
MIITIEEAEEKFGLGVTLLEYEDVKDKQNEYIWTYLDTDDGTSICNGYSIVNRIGYYLSEKPVPDGEYYEVPISRYIKCEYCCCETCKGSGVDGLDKECESCYGSGAEESCGNCQGQGYRTEWM